MKMISESSENSEKWEVEKTTKDISTLKDEIKLNNSLSQKSEKHKVLINQSNKLFKNDINIKKPKYYGKTKTLFFIGETPIFILCENSK